MKKLLLVLLVVALASFLMVGCLGTGTVVDDEDEDEDEVEPGICPTVSVTTQVEVAGKTYIKAGTQTITVTFAVPTEPVSLWIPTTCVEKGSPEGVPEEAFEVVLYPDADKKVYTGEFDFSEEVECCELYIYVLTCETCAPCKYPYIIDGASPYVKLKGTISGDLEDCPCGGCAITLSSVVEEDICDPDVVCCGDDCSELASWSFRLFDKYPWDVCCDTGCEDPIFEDSGTDCPITFTTDCLEGGIYYAVLNLADNVGNETNVAAGFVLVDTPECIVTGFVPVLPGTCDYDDYCLDVDDDGNPLIFIDPSGTMDEDCGWCEEL